MNVGVEVVVEEVAAVEAGAQVHEAGGRVEAGSVELVVLEPLR